MQVQSAKQTVNIELNDTSLVKLSYLKGTHIATKGGETTIESLKPGDQILAANGRTAIVKRIAQRTLYKELLPTKEFLNACPILIKKSALAEMIPHRDLLVSPDHHIYFSGALVRADQLTNGKTVLQLFEQREIEYVSIDLDQFDIVLAEGAPAESSNKSEHLANAERNSNDGSAPLQNSNSGKDQSNEISFVHDGPILESIRSNLLKRAGQLTHSMLVTDARLHLKVNGKLISASSKPVSGGPGTYQFRLPQKVGDIHILSRAAIARDMNDVAKTDTRCIGVGITAIRLIDSKGDRNIDLASAEIRGFHKAQQFRGNLMRWTNGEAVIPPWLCETEGKVSLELHVAQTYTYWAEIETSLR